MKKIFTILGIVSAISFMSAQTTVLTENFNFTGALNANGWTSHSGTAGQLLSNGSAAQLVAGNSEDVNKALSSVFNISTTGISKAEYSATINVANGTGISTAGDYFLMFTVASGANPGVFNARLFVKKSTTGYFLGILNNGAGTGATPTYGTEIPFGTPANITVAYIVDNSGSVSTNTATLQIDSQPLLTNTAGTGTAPATLGGIAIRQGSGTGNVTIGNLVVKVYEQTLAVTEIKKGKSIANFVKNTFVKNNEITFGADAKDVKIFNMFGQLVKEASVKANGTVNVAELTKGNYIVTGTVNNEAVSQKILKD